MKLLCITSQPDAHLPFVQKHLADEIIVFDPYKFLNDTDVTYEWDGKKFQISSREHHLNECDAVWYRKPRLLEGGDFPVDDMYRKYVLSAYTKTIQSLYVLLRDKFWVSDYWSIIRASNKLLQAEIAQELGLRIPNTMVTSSPDEARRFIGVNGDCITKMIGTHHVFDGTDSFVFYTAKVTEDLDLSGLPVAPAIFQKMVNKLFDIRVTVVGQQVFPCEIHQIGAISDKVDWREGVLYPDEREVLAYKFHENFPQWISQACIQMLKVLNLQYGAFDFVIDDVGQYWFLEVNPNGQWGFIEETTGLPIGKAFCELFNGNKRI